MRLLPLSPNHAPLAVSGDRVFPLQEWRRGRTCEMDRRELGIRIAGFSLQVHLPRV